MRKVSTFLCVFLVGLFLLQANNSFAQGAKINSFPWQESFETAVPPTDWEYVNLSSPKEGWSKNDGKTHGPNSVIDGTYAAMFNCYGLKKDSVATLTTPAFDLSGMTNVSLSFWVQCKTGSGAHPKLIVEYSKDGGVKYDTIFNKEADGRWDNWMEVKIVLPNKSNNYKIKFRGVSDWGSHNLFLDKVRVYEPVQMEYKSAAVIQKETSEVFANSTKNNIIGIKVNTRGELKPLDINKFAFTLTGTTNISDITKLQVFYTGNDSVFSADSLVAETTSITSGNITLNSKHSNAPKLKEGDNYFWLSADISATAAANNVVDATCESLTIGTSSKIPNPKTADGSRKITRTYLMKSGTNELTIDSDYLFFDDGGKDKNYSKDFEGTITFKPQNNSKKIRINWSDFQVFVYGSDPSENWTKNDIFKVYQGTTADDAKLIDRYYGYTNPSNFQKENNVPTTITSTDASGALTVYFKVKTGSPTKGWEATVSEITPQNMAYASSEVSSISKKNKVAAEESNIPLLKLAVSTNNTLSPITVSGLTVDLAGTTTLSDFAKLSVYSTGIKNTFSTTKKVGELTTINQNETSIAFSNAEQLQEATNYFWVTCDVAATAKHNNTLKIKCKNFSHSSNTTAEIPTKNASLTVTQTIDNTYKMPVSGTHTKTISNKIAFTDNDEGSRKTYKATKDVATVTFSPKKTGENIKMSFQEFDVYFTSSSYGTKAVFEIYDGSSTSSTLLWKADKDNKDKGPQGTISASNGSLTVKFSANTTTSYYTKKGWKAEVWSEMPTNMAFESSSVEQIEGVSSPGTINQQILKVNIKLKGTLNPISETVLTFNTEGSTDVADIAKAKLFFTSNNNEFANTKEVGTVVNQPNGSFSFTYSEALAEGNNYFWLVYDISERASLNNVVDAELSKIKLGNSQEQVISNGNPVGGRTIKNVYLMENGNHTVKISENPLDFYDDGGAEGKYGTVTGFVTFVPQPATNRVKLTISELELERWADFEIYNGSKKELVKRLKKFKSTDNISSTHTPYVFKSTADDGSLSVYFKRGSYNSSSNKAGWKAKLLSYVPSNTVYDSAWAEQQSNNVLRGSEAVILKIPVIFKGEVNNATIERLTFNINGTKGTSNFSKAKIYSTDTVSSFDPFLAKLVGESTNLSESNVSIPCNFNVSGEQTHYLWLCYDISLNAKENSKLDATFTEISVSGKNHPIVKGNPVGEKTVKSGMGGAYTIGYESGVKNFKTFESAINALKNSGIEDKVSFKIADGTYNEKVKIPHINGVSESNTITFESASEDATKVIITSDDYVASSNYSIKTAIFHFDGVDFVSLKNVSVKTNDKRFTAVVVLSNKSRNVTLENCLIEIPAGTGYSDGACVYTHAKNEANSNNDNLCLKNNIFKGGRIGINIGGTGYVALPKEKGFKAIGNTFEGQTAKGIYVHDEENIQIIGNKVINNTSNVNGFQGMDLYRIKEKSEVYNNYVSLTLNRRCIGIEFRPIQGKATDKSLVYNNVIIIKSATGASYGMLLHDQCKNTEFYYNTVQLTGSANTSSAFMVTGSKIPENILVKNNLFINKAGGYATQIVNSTFKDAFTFDFNNMYSSGTKLAKIGSTDLNDLTAWQGQVTATNSISENVVFYTASDLHIKEKGNLQKATPITLVSTDFDGITRSATTPTMGAYEYVTPNLEAPKFVADYPKTKNISAFKAMMEIASQSNANAYWVVLPSASTAPSVAEVKAGQAAGGTAVNANLKGQMEVLKNVVHLLEINNLEENSDYKIYVVLENNIQTDANTLKSLAFKTIYRPTEPSTFESLSAGSNDFTDGTAHFNGVKVVEATGAFSTSTKYIQSVENQALKITLSNTDTGLSVKGLFIKNDTLVKVKGLKADNSYTDSLEIPKREDWDYIELTSLGEVKHLVFEANKKVFSIDDFNSKPQPLKLVIAANNTPIKLGDTTEISSAVVGGVKPYKYYWSPDKNMDNRYKAMPKVNPKYSTEYTLKVTDKQKKEITKSTVVEVIGNVGEMDFEDLNLKAESYWKPKSDGTYKLFSKGFELSQNIAYKGSSWSGFSYSNKTNKNDVGGVSEQWTSIVGAGAKNSANYGVAYLSGSKRIKVSGANDTLISGMFVTNNTYAVSSMENGDSYAKKFGGADGTDPDWFKLTITGYNHAGTKTSSVDFYLADFRSDNSAEDYIVKDWRWVDLKDLGEVKQLKFELSSSDNSAYGMNTPAYFCFDNLNGTEKDAAPTVKNPIANLSVLQNSAPYSINLSQVFDDVDSDNAKISITASSSDSSLVIGVVDKQKLNLTFVKGKFGTAKITLKANSNGKIAETNFDVNVIENQAPEKYENGTFIVNEGWYGREKGSLNFVNSENKINYRAYAEKNKRDLGITTQFGTIYGDNLYLVSKQGNRLVVADALTLEKKAVIKEFVENEVGNKSDGRAFVGVNPKKGYVSTSKGIFIFDIEALSIKNKIANIGGEIGNMLSIKDYVFAVSKKDVFVIDAKADTLLKKISGGTYAGITRTIDGNIWVGADTALMKINPQNLKAEYIKLPKHAKVPKTAWAWNAGSLCAGIKDNSLYWTVAKGWSATKVYKFTNDTSSLKEPFVSLNGLEFYSAGIRINPETNELIAITKAPGWGDNYAKNTLIKYNAKTGEKLSETKLFQHYWFPAMAVFTDKAPTANALAKLSTNVGVAQQRISIEKLFADADNDEKIIKKSLKANDNNAVVEAKIENNYIVLTIKAEGLATITIEGESNGKIVETSFEVEVKAQPAFGVATFEAQYLENETYWKPTQDGTYSFIDNGFEFTQNLSYNGMAWNGFSYSNKTNKDEAGSFMNAHTAITGIGYKESANYGVCFVSGEAKVKVHGNQEGEVIKGMYVTNNTYAVSSMENGDSFTKKFGGANGTDPDWFKLQVFGYDKNGEKTDSVEFYLADYRSDKAEEDYIVKDWRYIDFKALGKVSELGFKLSSSDNGSYGMNTPAYFCFDDLNTVKTGVENNFVENKTIEVYPNPALDYVFIKTNFKVNRIEVIGGNGQVVSRTLPKTTTNETYELNINNLPSGVYLIRIVGEKETLIRKIVKQ